MKSYSNILCPYQQSIRLCVSDTWRLNKNMMVQMPTGIRYGGAVRHTERGGIGLFLPMAVTPLGGCGK